MTKKLKVSDTDKDLTDEDKRKLALGKEYFEIKARDAFMFGDIFLHFTSEQHEVERRKRNPFIEIGDRCRIQTGAIIGGNGFGYTKNDEGHYIHREHSYKVIIGDDVDIGNCTTIDRGRWRDTEIGNGTKIDNNSHIAHNVMIGEDCLIHAHVNLCGSVTIGDGCQIYPFVNIAPKVNICDGVTIGSHTLVRFNIDLPGTYISRHGKLEQIKNETN